MTIVLVTHDDEMARYARRILTFRDGLLLTDRAVAVLPPQEATT